MDKSIEMQPLVIPLSTHFNATTYNDSQETCVLLIYINSLDRAYFYFNLTMTLCTKQDIQRSD